VRSSIFIKLLLTLLVTLAVTLVLMLVIVNWSFQRGFVSYIQQGEMEQATDLAEILGEQYAHQGSWDFIRANPRRWPQALESAGIEMPLRPPGAPRGRDQAPPFHGRPPHQRPGGGPPLEGRPASGRPSESVPLVRRLSLVDAGRKPLAGPGASADHDHWLAVQSGGTTVGWVGLKPMEVVADRLARSFIDHQRDNFAWGSVAVLLLSVLVAAGWARLFLRPIHRVVQGAKQLAAGDYAVRVPVKGDDELAALALNFNQMAKALQRNEQLRRQWVADISHELRTPIAVIGGEVEALLDGIRTPTRQRIASLYSDISALGKLVEDLHQLSLADQGTLELVPTDVNLYALAQDLLLLFEPRMEQQGLTLSLEADLSQNLSLIGDERRLGQLLRNLLENSLRYTDTGGDVRLRLSSTGGMLSIQLSDSAPGVPDAELEKIFDRLYRVDKSRSRLVGGSGLGLSICKNIVQAHAGSIDAVNSSQGGLTIRVELPVSPRGNA
jgi:two-component system sensor histidine kinase BaeS